MTTTMKEGRGINLDELQQEIEKLLGLLKDRQPGLISWNEFMMKRLTTLHRLTSKALGKPSNEEVANEANRQVTSAIMMAEGLEAIKSEFIQAAWAQVSFDEHYLANQLEFGTSEWKLAWRGAIRAAMKAGNVERARNLITHLKVNLQVSQTFSAELEALLA